MSNLLPLICSLCCCGDPPVAAPASPVEVVASLEAALADAIARAEPSVVAISRTKGDPGDETTAVRGRNPAPVQPDQRVIARQFNLPNNSETVSFDYGSGVVIGAKGEILTAFHVVKGAERL